MARAIEAVASLSGLIGQKQRWRLWGRAIIALPLAVPALASCGSQTGDELAGGVSVVELPGASAPIDFDDIVYSPSLRRVLVPAAEDGLYLIEPDRGRADRVPGVDRADSVDAGDDVVFVLDRSAQRISVIDPETERVLSSTRIGEQSDYLRYVASRREIWVTEPSTRRIEVFALPDAPMPTPRPSGFISIPDGGPEGLTISDRTRRAYTHSFGGDLLAIDTERRTIAGRWLDVCDGAHGFPRISERDGLALASCERDGEVVLADTKKDGRTLGRYAVGGGVGLPAYSAVTDHFYVRSDPGDTIATLKATAKGLRLVRNVPVPEVGHCLTADDLGHYWTCDAQRGQILRITDSEK